VHLPIAIPRKPKEAQIGSIAIRVRTIDGSTVAMRLSNFIYIYDATIRHSDTLLENASTLTAPNGGMVSLSSAYH
jgi:hypothetical protein